MACSTRGQEFGSPARSSIASACGASSRLTNRPNQPEGQKSNDHPSARLRMLGSLTKSGCSGQTTNGGTNQSPAVGGPTIPKPRDPFETTTNARLPRNAQAGELGRSLAGRD